MKLANRIKLFCAILILFFCTFQVSGADLPTGEIKIGIYDNPPKLFLDDKNQPKGIFPGIIKDIAKKEGWNIKFIPLTFKQGLAALQNGTIDIMQDVAWSKQRTTLYSFTKETVMVSWGRLYKKKGLVINTLIDLKHKRIAVMDGGIYSEGPDGLKIVMRKFEIDAEFIPATGYKQVLNLVDSGKADAGIVNRLYGKTNKHKYDIEPTPILISPISIRFAFGKNNPATPQLIQIIDSHLLRMKKDQNSIYYQLIDEYIRKSPKSIPAFIKNLLLTLLFLSILFAVLWAMSSWQARKKTVQLRTRDQELKASEKKFRNIFENLQDVYFDTTIDGVYKMVSPSAEWTLGFPIDELIGHHVDKTYNNIADRQHLIDLLLKNGHVRDYEILCKKKDRSVYWISVNADLYHDRNHNPIGITGILRDITQRKKVREELLKREERFREMARLLPCGIVETDQNLNITYANQTGLDMFGYEQSDLKKPLNAMDTLHENDQKIAAQRIEKYRQGKSIPASSIEYKTKKKDGTQLNVLLQAKPIWDNKKIIGYRGSISDLTELKQLQKEILRTQKLESTGMLAGGIAHDFNNILLGLFGNISLAKSELSSTHSAFTLLREAEKSMSRAKNLTTQLLTFAQGGNPIKSAITIEQIIRETANFNLSGSNIKMTMEHPEELWQVNADKSQISQVIANLVINARHAMADGGTLTIKMENAALSEKDYATLELDKYVKISITDQGHGISEKYLEKIFDPYFTTKQDGSGLGLSIVHSIILKHNGYIYVNSALEKGTTFVIYLPAVETPLNQENHSNKLTHSLESRSVNILIMDDDQLVLDVTERILKKLGHTVTSCKNGNDVITLYKKAMKNGHGFDIVIMDLTIPGGMGGREANQKLLKIDPLATVVVASGYSTDPVLANFIDYGFKAVITKPYTVEKINQVIDNALSF
ncbi:MAG: PAS domain S-box protein [Desulfobacula sp.]|nr:PAS domain S-box protein [Desulfobacula sp.]